MAARRRCSAVIAVTQPRSGFEAGGNAQERCCSAKMLWVAMHKAASQSPLDEAGGETASLFQRFFRLPNFTQSDIVDGEVRMQPGNSGLRLDPKQAVFDAIGVL